MPTKTKAKTLEHKIDIYDTNKKKLETIDLDKKVFDGKVNTALLHQAMVMYDARKRQGNASTKIRSEVRGGGKKPWRQKGTGRARFGSSRNPIWRGGGVAFGPQPRDYSYSIPRKMRLSAIKSALNAKFKDKEILVIDDIKLAEPKTKKVRAILNKLSVEGKILLVTEKVDDTLKRASRNLKGVRLTHPETICSDDLIRYTHLVITKKALQKLTKRVLS